MNQAHNRADDADGRRVATHALENLGRLSIACFLGHEVHFQNAPNRFGFSTVDQQLQAFARIGIGFPVGDGFKPEQPFLACNQAPVDDTVNPTRQIDAWREQNPANNLQGSHKRTHGRLQQRSRQSSTQYDQGCRTIEQGAQVSALQEIAANNGDKRQDDPNQAQHIHQRQASTKCLPISSRLYTASARSALTIAIGMP